MKTLEEKREYWRVATKKWRDKNKERHLRYARLWRLNHPDKIRVYRKTRLERHTEKVLKLRKQSYHRRKQKILAWNKEYFTQNKERILVQKAKRDRERRATDPAFRCKKLLQNRIMECLKLHQSIKSIRTMELIGCDRAFLVKWIESKFQDGMTWANHGNNGWHLDHIRPCASFDLSNHEEQKRCFHYTNLQPLWASENRIKSDKCHYQSI